MWCVKCNKPWPSMCTCPDRTERMKEIRAVCMTKWCKKCDNHYALCTCPAGDADFTVMFGDKDLGCGPFKNLAGSMTVVNPKTGEVTIFKPEHN